MSKENIEALRLREAAGSANVEVVRRAFECWREGDYDALLEFFLSTSAPDVELHSRIAGLAGEPFRGHDGLRTWLWEIQDNFERFEPWLDDARDAGNDRVVALGGISFTAGGVDMDTPMGWVQEFRDGLLRCMRFYRSPEEALDAVGMEK